MCLKLVFAREETEGDLEEEDNGCGGKRFSFSLQLACLAKKI